ncbi:hypothetical protein K8R03_00570 [Candidatus Kaiserbacteria bacterium]|nr:hypothetical protein [Candidatus Kaiserbacteria bacterium]
MPLFMDVKRLAKSGSISPKFALLPTDEALNEVHQLLAGCFGENDIRRRQIAFVLAHVYMVNGTVAAKAFLKLDRTSQFFVKFALEIYGMELESKIVRPKPPDG